MLWGSPRSNSATNAFSKLTSRLYGKNIWPMEYKKSQGRYFYRMEDQVAQWWLDSRDKR